MFNRFKRDISVLLLLTVIPVHLLFAQLISDRERTGYGVGQNDSTGKSFRERVALPGGVRGRGIPGGGLMGMPGGGMMGGVGNPLGAIIYQVHVLGEVQSPATYRVTASDRLSEILEAAGGIDVNGSERQVELRRNGEPVRKVDLLKFRVFGDLSNNPYLQDNDVVFVPLKANTIRVVGAVKRPREYDIAGEKTLADAINLAGNFSVGVASDQQIHVVRFVNDKKQVLTIGMDKPLMQGFKIQNGDIVYVPHVITDKNQFDFNVPKLPGDNIFFPSYEDRVFVLGPVKDPGAYPFSPYYKMSQYLSLAGGTTLMAKNVRYVVRGDGTTIKVRKGKQDKIIINPGDTILIREKKLDTQGWIGFFMSITGFVTSSILAIVAIARI